MNFLVNFANHRYEQEGPNSDYIKIAGVSDTLESSANEELLLGELILTTGGLLRTGPPFAKTSFILFTKGTI